MHGRSRRTLIAGLLTTAAVAVPCAAWWAAGSRAVERERAALTESVEADARRHAVHLAERLRGRLDSVLRHESQRPYYEYAYRYQDPKLSCECATWVESPLARGASEPMIRAHFELDRKGALTVPSIPPADADVAAAPDPGEREIAQELRAAAAGLAGAAWSEGPRNVADGVTVSYGDEVVLVDPFHWHTIAIGGEPQLVAIRTVAPPQGRKVQGFVIAKDAIHASLPDEPFPAEFRPMPVGAAESRDRSRSRGAVTEPIGLEGAPWEIALDVGNVRQAAMLRGDALQSRFVKTFLGGSGAALVAAVLLIGLVAQSERIARDRSRFAASAAHELRTPLAGLRVYGEMLADDLGDPKRRKDYARQVAAEADRLSRVVSNVLGHAKLERGTLAVETRNGDLASSVRAAVERLRPTVEAHGATVDLVIGDALPDVPFDEDAVGQMLANLVDNAERYSRAAADRRVHVRLRPEGDGVALEVADHGGGIPPAERKRLFRPFGRGSDPDAPAGLGLGLAMVAHLARAHGGLVRCDDAPGGGSLFTVLLPA